MTTCRQQSPCAIYCIVRHNCINFWKKIGMTPPVLCFSAKHTLLIKIFVLFGMCSCIQSDVSTRTAPLWHSVVQLLPFHLVDGINHWLQHFIVHGEWCAWHAQTHLSETCSYSLEKVNNANITGKRIPSWNKTTVKRVTWYRSSICVLFVNLCMTVFLTHVTCCCC